MIEKENKLAAPEKELYPSFDGIVVLGRGIEQVDTVDSKRWRPTRSIEKPSPEGGHSGFRSDLETDSDEALIAGANANAIASTELFEELAAEKNSPKVVMFSAGRPKYLENEAESSLSEGGVLAETFKRRIGNKIGDAELIVLSKNKNTKDDIVSALTEASNRSLKKLAFITISLHVERANEFLNIAKKENPQFQNIETEFVSAEDLLEKRYSKSGAASSMFKKGIEQLRRSKAWERTKKMEHKGTKDLQEGRYGQKT